MNLVGIDREGQIRDPTWECKVAEGSMDNKN